MNNQDIDEVWDAMVDWCDNVLIPRKEQEALSTHLEHIEKEAIVNALMFYENNRTKAASSLGMGRTLLLHKIKKYKLLAE
jgi:transcriptional regulator with PAS, ATPase and Fis domain